MQRDFEWHHSYSLGHDWLDEQNKNLLRLCKRASDCAAGIFGDDVYHETLNDLVAFALAHIDFEEALLQRCNYLHLEEQKKEHTDLIATLMDFVEVGSTKHFNKSLLADLAWEWWCGHVLVSDMKFRSSVMKLGAEELSYRANGIKTDL